MSASHPTPKEVREQVAKLKQRQQLQLAVAILDAANPQSIRKLGASARQVVARLSRLLQDSDEPNSPGRGHLRLVGKAGAKVRSIVRPKPPEDNGPPEAA